MNPGTGFEQAGNRPCLVLQTNGMAEFARTYLVAPMTSKKLEKVRPYQVPLKPVPINGLKVNSKVKLDQMLVVDCSRLLRKIGKLEKKYHPSVFRAIDIILDRRGDFRNI